MKGARTKADETKISKAKETTQYEIRILFSCPLPFDSQSETSGDTKLFDF